MKNNIIKILRKNPTPWESKLWYHLRNRNLNGVKFRRQFKIDKYVVDFCCLEKKLIIELDTPSKLLSTSLFQNLKTL